MTDLRLLTLAFAFVLTCGTWLQVWGPGFYTCGPVWGRRVEGQVVDKRTGDPVEGAGVFTHYTVPKLQSLAVDWRWTTTDADGRFTIPGHVAVLWLGRFGLLKKTDKYPTFYIVHPRYGQSLQSFGDAGHYWPGWRSLDFEMEQNDFDLERIREPHRLHNWANLCVWPGMPPAATDECCRILWGSADICRGPVGGTQ